MQKENTMTVGQWCGRWFMTTTLYSFFCKVRCKKCALTAKVRCKRCRSIMKVHCIFCDPVVYYICSMR